MWLDCMSKGKLRIYRLSLGGPASKMGAHWTTQEVFHKISLSRLTDSSPVASASVLLLTGWYMTHRTDVARGRDVVARWCVLAEQRLEYLTELFETGRWRRYHSELDFLENIQEAKAAVEIWRDLLTREASRDNSAIDMSWLGRTMAALPPGEGAPDQSHRLPPEIPAEPLRREVSIAVEAKNVRLDVVIPVPEPDAPALDPSIDNVSQLVPDIAAMQERYPLLRNAM
jgi:uncharacterized repeat protein (TIGR03809 family)